MTTPMPTFVVDARVHRLSVAKSSDGVAIVLRKDDQFVTAFVQVSVAGQEVVEKAKHLTLESLVRVSGTLLGDHDDQHDMQVSSLSIISEAKAGLPRGLVSHGGPGEPSCPFDMSVRLLNERLDNRVIDARVAGTAAIFKLFSGAYQLCVEHLTANAFHWTPTPKLISYKVPGDEDYFVVPYPNGQQAQLTQTGEVHLAMALSADLERVYDIHTVFRREPHVTTRHLSEFTTVEVAFALKYGWSEVLERAERMVLFLIQSLQQRPQYKVFLEQAARVYPAAATFKLGLDKDGHLPRATFLQAKQILRDCGSAARDSEDFTAEEEAALGCYAASPESLLGAPSDIIVVTDYPRHLRPYNFHPSADDPDQATNSFDILIRGQECASGLHLIHSYQDLKVAMAARKPPIDPNSVDWQPFMAAHEAGMPPCGGFGMGLNRFIQGFLGLSDIHETVLFPRDASRLAP